MPRLEGERRLFFLAMRGNSRSLLDIFLITGGEMETAETIMQTWMSRVWNQLDSSAIDELLAAEAPVHGLGEAPLIGPTGFREFHAGFAAAFSDIQMVVERQVVAGENVAGQFSGTMTHRASGTPVTVGGMVILTCRDGQIREGWNAADFLPMLTQLGIVAEDAVERAMTPPA